MSMIYIILYSLSLKSKAEYWCDILCSQTPIDWHIAY